MITENSEPALKEDPKEMKDVKSHNEDADEDADYLLEDYEG